MKPKDLTKNEANYLLEMIHDATLCTDDDGFKNLIIRINSLIPFESAGAVLSKEPSGKNPGPMLLVNINHPSGYGNEYITRSYQTIDPVIKDNYGIYRIRFWADSFEHHGLPRELHGLAEDFGLNRIWKGHGYSCGMRNTGCTEKGLISFYGLLRKERHERILTLVSPHLHEAMSRILGKHDQDFPPISNREMEILQWLMQGKSTWDISMILRISERTVKFHIDNIMKKLDAVNRTHAVAIALRHRLIDLD